MPRLDGTGPTGAGAMTGRGQGSCRTTKAAKYGVGLGLGLGLGLALRRGFRSGRAGTGRGGRRNPTNTE